MTALIDLHLCVNHHRNGMPTGKCSGIELGDMLLSLDSPYIDRSLKCEIMPNSFRLGASHTWTHHGHSQWVGNWCWDVVKVEPACAVDVLKWAFSKGYKPHCGESYLWDRLEGGELNAMDLLTRTAAVSKPGGS